MTHRSNQIDEALEAIKGMEEARHNAIGHAKQLVACQSEVTVRWDDLPSLLTIYKLSRARG